MTQATRPAPLTLLLSYGSVNLVSLMKDKVQIYDRIELGVRQRFVSWRRRFSSSS